MSSTEVMKNMVAAGDTSEPIHIKGVGSCRLEFNNTVGTVILEYREDEVSGWLIDSSYSASTGRMKIDDPGGAWYRWRMVAFTSGVGVQGRIDK